MEVGCTQGATPAASVKYQWYRNDVPIAGAAGSVFIIPATDTVSVGRTVYRAEISNAAPSSASLSVEVNVRATTPTVAPICSGGLTASPAAIPTGGSTEVTLSMGGCPSGVSYAWSPPSISTSQAQSSLVLKPQLSAVGDSITYVANVCYTAAASLCTPYSAKVTATTLTVIVPPLSGCNVTSSASSVTVGGTATLAVAGCAPSASAGSAPTFQWYLDNVPIVGATQSTYAIPLNATAVPGTYTYKVVVKNSAPSEYQGSWVITVGASRVLPLSGCRISPSAVEVAVGATATLVATCAAGTETSSGVAYQWRRAGVVIPGATLSSYSLSASDTANAGSGLYSASITNSAPSTVSLGIAVTVTSPATPGLTGCVITPDVVTVTVGNTASLTASCAQGLTAATTFQWSRDGISLAGATSPSYVVPTFATTTPGTFSYTVSVANSLSSSAIATSSVRVVPAAPSADPLTGCSLAPATQSITTGTATSLSVTCARGAASGSGVTYAWARNGVSLIGASGASYAVSAAETSTVGVFSYSVSIANAAPSTASASMSLTVTAPAAVTPVCTGAMIASPATVPIGVATVVTFSVGGCANGAQYRWTSPISSFTTPTATDTITLSASRPYAAYTVVVCASAPSSNCTGFSVAVRSSGSTAISGCAVNTDSTVAAVGSSPQLTATCALGTEAGSGVNYQWYRNSTPISGATNSTYVVPASDMIAGVSIAYAFIVSNPNASATAFTVISVSADTRSESCLATPVSVVIKASEPYRKFYTSNYHTTPPGGYFVVAVDVDASDSTVGRYLAEVGFSDFGATRSGRYVTMSKSKCDFTEGAQWISVNVGGVKLAENAGGGTIAMGADTRPASAKLTPGRWYLNFQNPPGACPANVASCDAVISWMN